MTGPLERDPQQTGWAAGRHFLRLLAIAAFFALWFWVYSELNARGAQSPRAMTFQSPIERYPWLYQPWTAIIYVFGGYLICVVPFLWNWTGRWIRFVLTAYGIASVLAFICYAIWPVVMIRPDYAGEGVGVSLMRWVISVDDAANCLPSSHVLFAVLGPLLVARGKAQPWLRYGSWILGASICITTVTVGQHYFIDILGGVIVASAGYLGASLLFREVGVST